MQLRRVIPRGNYVREQAIFHCHHCEVSLTQAGDGRPGCSTGEPIAPAVSPAETPATWVGIGHGADAADAIPQTEGAREECAEAIEQV